MTDPLKQWHVYALIDPRNSEVRYIGRTNRKPSDRLRQHRNERSATPKNCWVVELIKQHQGPLMRILETGHGHGEKAAEERWTRHYIEQGARLTNSLVGCRKFTAAQISKLETAQPPVKVYNVFNPLRRRHNPAERERFLIDRQEIRKQKEQERLNRLAAINAIAEHKRQEKAAKLAAEQAATVSLLNRRIKGLRKAVKVLPSYVPQLQRLEQELMEITGDKAA